MVRSRWDSRSRVVTVETNVLTSRQQELWGTVVASKVGGRATTGVYIAMGGIGRSDSTGIYEIYV